MPPARPTPALQAFALVLSGLSGRAWAEAPPGEPTPAVRTATPPTSPERLKPIARFALVEGKLWAEVYAHTLDTVDGPLPCWTYATVGMRSAQQKEMLLTVKREKGEPESAFDRFLPNLFTHFYQFAQQGQCVDVGSYTQLGPGGTPLLGRPDFLGLLYTAPQPLPGIEVTADHLTVLLVTGRELQLGLKLGLTRLLSRLGESTHWFPVPPWTDRKRPEAFAADEAELTSLLVKVPGLSLPGIRVHIDDGDTARGGASKEAPPPGSGWMVRLPSGRVVLTVAPRAALKLQKALPGSKSADMLCLHAEWDPMAEAGLVWKAGDSKPMAISRPGSTCGRVAGNYLLLVGGQPRTEMKGLEDGFCFLLTPKDWTRVLEALTQGQPLTLPAQDGTPSLVLRWAP